MATSNPFAYNPGSPIAGTDQVGQLSIGTPTSGFTNSPQYWNGPNEDLGYVIALPKSGNTQPTPVTTNRVYLSPTYKGTDVILSNSNQTANQLFGYQQSVLGINPIGVSDKVMFSVLCTLANPGTAPDSHFVGVGYTSMNYQGNPYDGFPGNDNQSMGYGSNGTIWYNGSVYLSGLQTWGNNDIIDIVVDNSASTMWVRVNGGNWNNNPFENPATNTGGFEIISGPFYPVICPGYEGTMIIQNSPAYNIPSGYNFLATLSSVGFLGTKNMTNPLSESTFVELVNGSFNQSFTNGNDASIWLTNNGYWNSWVSITPTPTATLAVTPTPTPTLTQTPTATDLTSITTYTISGCTSLNVFVANLGPGALAPGDVFYFDFTGGTPSGCYRIVNKIDAVPTEGTTPLYFYSSCALCVAAREVTPTPTSTIAVTPTPTTTSTPTVTPTLTPTPSTTPSPVTGYSFNLVVLPYNYPSSGNTIMVDQAVSGTGTTNPNLSAIQNNAIYFNAIDTNGVNRTSYFAGFTGQSITLTISQTGSTAIYSGSTTAFQSWNSGGDSGFSFGYGISQPGYTSGTTVLTQSATTNWVTGQTVYISASVNGPGVTPTPTSTSVTPTPTPTSGYTSDGWLFYSPDNQPVLTAPTNNGNTTFIDTGGGNGTYNPNYTGGTLNIYFNNNTSAGTSYASQFSTLDTAGGTITISQGSSTAIYSGTSSQYNIPGNFLQLVVTNPAQMIQSASTPFVSGTSINVVVS